MDMVEKVKRYARFDSDYLILVVDSAALKVFSSCCQLYELVSISKIYQLEKLEKVRKQYKQTDAIYFITPTKESIALLNKDF